MCTCACVVPEEFIWGQWLSLVGVTGDCELSNIMVRSRTQTFWESRKFSLLSQSFPAGILLIINIIFFMLFDVHEDNIVELVLSSRLYMGFRDCRACVAFTQCIHHLTSSGLLTVNCVCCFWETMKDSGRKTHGF